MYLDIILQLASIYCAVKVFDIKNPVSSILFLIGLFINVSIYLYINGLTFVSLSFIIIYVGAISVLFIFIIMLLDIRISEIQNDNLNSTPLAIIIFILISYFLFKILMKEQVNSFISVNRESASWLNWKTNSVNIVTNNNWDNNIVDVNHIVSIGSVLYTSYNIWLIIISIILLLAMIGSILITLDRP